jgi:hypothetical protein
MSSRLNITLHDVTGFSRRNCAIKLMMSFFLGRSDRSSPSKSVLLSAKRKCHFSTADSWNACSWYTSLSSVCVCWVGVLWESRNVSRLVARACPSGAIYVAYCSVIAMFRRFVARAIIKHNVEYPTDISFWLCSQDLNRPDVPPTAVNYSTFWTASVNTKYFIIRFIGMSYFFSDMLWPLARCFDRQLQNILIPLWWEHLGLFLYENPFLILSIPFTVSQDSFHPGFYSGIWHHSLICSPFLESFGIP